MNSTSMPPRTLNAMLSALAEEHGGETALIFGGDSVSFSELERRVRKLAGGLSELGIGRGDRVAIWLPNIPAWLEMTFALARLGAIAVAVNTQYRKQEVQDIIKRSGARLLVLQPRLGNTDYLSIAEQLDPDMLGSLEAYVLVGEGLAEPELKGHKVLVYGDLLAGAEYKVDDGGPEMPCNVFTSSGTTSAPKLILHKQTAIVQHAEAVAHTFRYRQPAAVILDMLPVCGVFGFSMVMGAIASGRPMVMLPTFDAFEAVTLIEQHKVTHTAGSDEMFRRILATIEQASQLASLQEGAFANFGADARVLVDQGDAHGINLFQTYGSSEVQALMTYPPAGSDAGRRTLGGGVPCSDDTQVRVREPGSGHMLGYGETGEIEIRGPNVMLGFMNNQEAEDKAFTEDGYVRTGDLGYMEGPNQFVYLARLGDTLRLGGFLVNPREIEAFLEGYDAVELAQIVAVDTERGPRPVAFVTLKTGNQIDENAITEDCLATMAKFKVPIRIAVLDEFPVTQSANGKKIQKAKLRDMAKDLLTDTAPG